MNRVPENLVSLHAAEEILHEKSLTFVKDNKDFQSHLEIMESAMDILDVLRKTVPDTQDGRTIGSLSIRAFNSFATAWKLTSCGYYQVAAMILRDLIETSNLASYFHIQPSKISEWRSASRKDLKRNFGPADIRKALDAHAGTEESRREKIYIKFCMLAAHPTADGFAMLRPANMDATMGPFSDVTAFKALLEEIGMLSLQSGFAFGIHLDLTDIKACTVMHRFISLSMEYSDKFLGKTYSEEEKHEVDRIFSRP